MAFKWKVKSKGVKVKPIEYVEFSRTAAAAYASSLANNLSDFLESGVGIGLSTQILASHFSFQYIVPNPFFVHIKELYLKSASNKINKPVQNSFSDQDHSATLV